jgi:hypothetical protein
MPRRRYPGKRCGTDQPAKNRHRCIPSAKKYSSGHRVGRAWLSASNISTSTNFTVRFQRCVEAARFRSPLPSLTCPISLFLCSQVRKVSDAELLLTVVSMLSITTLFLGVYSGLPINEPRVAEGSGSQAGRLVAECHNRDSFAPWIAVLLVYIFLLMVGAAALAFKTRDLPSRIHESTHLMNGQARRNRVIGHASFFSLLTPHFRFVSLRISVLLALRILLSSPLIRLVESVRWAWAIGSGVAMEPRTAGETPT